LIPEGWLLDIASENWKINKNDRMGLLLACCKNCIGAVSVEPIVEEDEK
jgi:serine/threonine-protein kinase HipA